MRIHKGRPHAYPCDECDLKFTKTHILEHHIGRLHASELQPLKRKHTCDECDEKFAAESLLRVHKERPDAYPCDECDLKFVHRSNLRHHKGRPHASRLNPAVAKSVDNKFD